MAYKGPVVSWTKRNFATFCAKTDITVGYPEVVSSNIVTAVQVIESRMVLRARGRSADGSSFHSMLAAPRGGEGG